MRKITIVAIVMAVCGIVSVSCSKDSSSGSGALPIYDNAIWSYTNTAKPCTMKVGDSNSYISWTHLYPNHFARVSFMNTDGRNDAINGGYVVGFLSGMFDDGEKIKAEREHWKMDYDTYDSLMYAHNDVDLPKKVGLLNATMSDESVTYTPIKKITVTSSKDYDAAHPAGTDLADVLDISFMSYAEVLANDFDYDKIKIGKRKDNGLVIKESLSQFNTENRKLLSWMYGLYARKQPVEKSGHVITVTMEFADGNVFTSTSEALDIF
jgi:hypothetical protein